MSKISRNQLCPCGSGKKHKRCCIGKQYLEKAPPFNVEEFLKLSQKFEMKREEELSNNSFVDYAKSHESSHILNLIISCQLIPENHSKNIRIEKIAKIVATNLNDNLKGDVQLLKKEIAKHFDHHHLEDPPEALYTENILFHGGNYTVFNGIATNSADILRFLTEAIFIFQSKKIPLVNLNELHSVIKLTLELGNWFAQKANLSPNINPAYTKEDIIFPPQIYDFGISQLQLVEICNSLNIDVDTINHLICNPNDGDFKSSNFEMNPLLYAPVIKFKEKYYFLLLTAQLHFLNEFIFEYLAKYDLSEKILGQFHDLVWSEILLSTKAFGWKLTDIVIPTTLTNDRYIDAFLQFDYNSLCHVIYLKENKTEGKRAQNASRSYYQYEMTNDRINEVLEHFKSNKNYKEIEIFTLVVIGDFGHLVSFGLENSKNKNYKIWFNAYHFLHLCKTENWNNLSIYKYAKVYNIVTEKIHFIATSPLDIYFMYKNHNESFYINDDQISNIITIQPGSGSELLFDAKIKRNIQGVKKFIRNDIGLELVETYKDYKNIYHSLHFPFSPILIIIPFSFPIRVKLIGQKSIESDGVIFLECICFWLSKLSNTLKIQFNNCIIELIEIELVISDNFYSKDFRSINSSDDGIHVAIIEKKKIVVHIDDSYLSALYDNNNDAEGYLIFNIVKALFEFCDIELLSNLNDIIAEVMQPQSIRKIIVMDTFKNPRLNNKWLLSKYYISDAEIGLLLDKATTFLEKGYQKPYIIKSKDDKIEFCNLVVSKFLQKLQCKIMLYNKKDLLNLSLELLESLVFEREHNKIVLPPRIVFHNKENDVIEKYKLEEKKLVKTSLSLRCLIELISSMSFKGNLTPSISIIDEFLALMHEIEIYGSISDSIFLNINEPEIEILKSGRIGISKDFHNNNLKEFSDANIETEVNSYILSHESRIKIDFETRVVSKSKNEEELDLAFLKDFGFTLTELITVMVRIVEKTIQLEKSVHYEDKKSVLKFLTLETKYEEEKLCKILAFITIQERENYLIAPTPYKNDDVFPWKYNREISLLKRPIIEYSHDDKLILMWGFRTVEDAISQIIIRSTSGRLKYIGENLKAITGAHVNKVSKQHRKNVSDWFKKFEIFEVIDFEVKINKNGHLKSNDDLGDIDLLVLDRKNSKVYNIECKDTYQAKAIHQMKTEIDSFIGRGSQNNKIEKHLKRHNFLINQSEQLQNFLGITIPLETISLIITSDVLSIAFTKKNDLKLPILSLPELNLYGPQVLSRYSKSL